MDTTTREQKVQESGSALFPRLENAARYAAMALMLLLAVVTVWAVLGLVADGAFYMWNILHTEHFYLYPSRFLTQAITQAPLMGAIGVGVNDVPTLIRLQSFGTAALPILIWVGALWALRKHRAFWLFVIAFAVVYLNSGFVAVGEYNLANAAVALSAALLVSGPSTIVRQVLLVIAGVALFASYESVAFLAVPLIALALLRRTVLGRALTITLIAIYAAAIAYAAFWIIFPRDATNLGGAADILQPLKFDYSLTISLAIAVAYVLIWLYGNVALQRVATVVLTVAGVVLLLPPLYFAPWMHYAARTLAAVALFGIIAAVTVREYRPRARPESGSMWVAAAVLLVGLTVPFAYRAVGYTHWVAAFNGVTVQPGGPTKLKGTGIHEGASYLFAWTYTNPMLSEILHSGEGQKVILNPGQGTEGKLWLPAPIAPRFTNTHPLF